MEFSIFLRMEEAKSQATVALSSSTASSSSRSNGQLTAAKERGIKQIQTFYMMMMIMMMMRCIMGLHKLAILLLH